MCPLYFSVESQEQEIYHKYFPIYIKKKKKNLLRSYKEGCESDMPQGV